MLKSKEVSSLNLCLLVFQGCKGNKGYGKVAALVVR